MFQRTVQYGISCCIVFCVVTFSIYLSAKFYGVECDISYLRTCIKSIFVWKLLLRNYNEINREAEVWRIVRNIYRLFLVDDVNIKQLKW
jgi:hypothetical protein